MNRKYSEREKGVSDGFTLIEVMVAILIISVVIAALLQLFSTNTNLLGTVKEKFELSTQGSVLLGVEDVGFENKQIPLDRLLQEFKLDDELRQKLKTIKVDVTYKEVMRLDNADFQEDRIQKSDTEAPSLELGRTFFEINRVSTSFLRLRLQ